MFKNIPIKTVENNHEQQQEQQQYDNEQLVAMIHRLIDERDVLWRENEYLKAKLNESILIETINEIRKERDLLLKLLLNLSTNNHQHHHTEEEFLYVWAIMPTQEYENNLRLFNNYNL